MRTVIAVLTADEYDTATLRVATDAAQTAAAQWLVLVVVVPFSHKINAEVVVRTNALTTLEDTARRMLTPGAPATMIVSSTAIGLPDAHRQTAAAARVTWIADKLNARLVVSRASTRWGPDTNGLLAWDAARTLLVPD